MKKVVRLITTYLAPLFITFPTMEECEGLNRKWLERQPAMVGAVLSTDGIMIPVDSPVYMSEVYIFKFL